MDEVEALARAYCRERNIYPETFVPCQVGHTHYYRQVWMEYVPEARKRLDDAAWARAMEAVKRDA